MKVNGKVLKKWTEITLACGAHSFIWGLLVGTIIGMLLGLATLIFLFAIIESHPAYQLLRSRNPLLANAIDTGINMRLNFAPIILFSLILFIPFMLTGVSPFIIYALPTSWEIFIGQSAIDLTRLISGIRLADGLSYGTYCLLTYMTTMLTGLIHAALLAMLCGGIYGWLKIKEEKV
ncbi:MAG: hypothetical protein J0L97_07190 [Alphaproteobacteria bacterium]|nr:hypothetical protein [Alphaproteobacteria bacterium]